MELPKRRPNRLRGFDYNSGGAYFLTMCSKDRAHIFSHVVGRGIPDAPENILTAYGKCVESTLAFLAESNKNVQIEKYVIMPNHVHLLLSVNGNDLGASGMPRPTNAAIPKFVSSLKRSANKKSGIQLWQSGYHDHVVRDETDYLTRWRYIDENPARWEEDRYYGK